MLSSSSATWHRVKRFFGLYDRTIFLFTIFSSLFLLVHWVVIGLFIVPRLGNLGYLRLHYTASLGIDWVGNWWYIGVYPGFALLVFLANGYVAGRLVSQHRVFGVVMAVMTMLIELALVVAGSMAILLNR